MTGATIFAAEAGSALLCAEKWLAVNQIIPDTGDFSLCHELSEFLELFMEAERVFRQVEFGIKAENCLRLASSIAHTGSKAWPCGIHGGDENPSLMLGLAGIGLMFLRCARHEVAGAGLLYGKPMNKARRIIKLEDTKLFENTKMMTQDIVELIPGSKIDRISKRGRIILRLPTDSDVSSIIERLEKFEWIRYAEEDVQTERPKSEQWIISELLRSAKVITPYLTANN